MTEDPECLRERMIRDTDGEIDAEIAEALAATAGRALEWLLSEGVETRPKGDEPYQRHALYPHRPGTGRRIAPEYGPDRMMRKLYDNFRGDGGRVLLAASRGESIDSAMAVVGRSLCHSDEVGESAVTGRWTRMR